MKTLFELRQTLIELSRCMKYETDQDHYEEYVMAYLECLMEIKELERLGAWRWN